MEEYYENMDEKNYIQEKGAKIFRNNSIKTTSTTNEKYSRDSLFKNTYFKQLMSQNEKKTYSKVNEKSKRAPGEKSRRGTTLEAEEMPLNKILEFISNGDLLLKNIDNEQGFKVQQLI